MNPDQSWSIFIEDQTPAGLRALSWLLPTDDPPLAGGQEWSVATDTGKRAPCFGLSAHYLFSLSLWPLKLLLCCQLVHYSALLLYLQEAKEGGQHSLWLGAACTQPGDSPSPCVCLARQAKQQGRDCHSFTMQEEVRNEKCFRKRPKSC